MKILVHPQPSMRSYDDGRWIISRDSQINRIVDWAEHLPQDWEWTMLLPNECQMDKDWQARLKQFEIVHTWWPENVLLARYFMPDIDPEIMEGKDLLFCEVPELVKNWRAFMAHHSAGLPIATLVIHLAHNLHMDIDYTSRQLDGIRASDIAAFQLPGTLGEFTVRCPGLYAAPWEPKVKVWPALFSSTEVNEHHCEKRKRITINFTARLSDNDRTHYREFFKAINLLDSYDFDVFVMNPNEAHTSSEIMSWSDRITFVGEAGSPNRETYLKLLWRSHIVPILWPQANIHSRSFCEAIAAGCLVLTSGQLPDWRLPSLSLKDSEDPEMIAEALGEMIKAWTRERWVMKQHDQREWLAKNRSIEENIHFVREDLEAIRGIHR